MLFQGLTLTIVGMSVVFIFLTLLVFGMKLLTIVVKRFPGEPEPSVRRPAVSSRSAQKSVIPAPGNEAAAGDLAASIHKEIAAAVAAITAFRKK